MNEFLIFKMAYVVIYVTNIHCFYIIQAINDRLIVVGEIIVLVKDDNISQDFRPLDMFFDIVISSLMCLLFSDYFYIFDMMDIVQNIKQVNISNGYLMVKIKDLTEKQLLAQIEKYEKIELCLVVFGSCQH